jgi:hypothetical protein
VRNPLRRKPKVTTLDDERLAKELQEVAGLREIHGSQHLRKRIEFTDEAFVEVIKDLQQQRNLLLPKANKTPAQVEEIACLNRRIDEWIFYRMAKKSAVAWQTTFEDKDMSERWMAAELIFFRNEGNAAYHELILASFSYLHDISFKEDHVKTPTPVIVHSNIVPGYGGVDLAVHNGRAKTEEVP